MKKILVGCTFILCFFSLSLHSQSSDSYSFIGTIQLKDKSIITYKLVFSINETGEIEGKSITDFSGDHRTESGIIGKISADKKRIQFQETHNILTRSDFPDSSFCYVHMPYGKIKLRKNKSIIQGYFIAKYKDGSKCLDGDIYLMGEEQFYKKMTRSVKKARILMSKDTYEKTKTSIDNVIENSSKLILKGGDDVVFNTSLDTISLLVSDPQHEDGDIIAISVNGELKFPSIKVLKESTRINIPITGRTVIGIKAINEGRIPPNSAQVTLNKSILSDRLEIQLNKNKEATLTFVKI